MPSRIGFGKFSPFAIGAKERYPMRRDKIMLMGRVFLIVTPFMFFANLRETISPSRVGFADKET